MANTCRDLDSARQGFGRPAREWRAGGAMIVEAGAAVLLRAFTSLPRFAEDIAAGLAWMRPQAGISPDRLLLLSHSVGTAACLLHASRHQDVRAVVSLAAFAHPREVMRGFLADKRMPYPLSGWYVMRQLPRMIGARFDDVAPVNTIARAPCPVLVVHGREGTVVPTDDASRLVAHSGRARLLALDGDHDLREALAPHAATVVEFLRAACQEPAPAVEGVP